GDPLHSASTKRRDGHMIVIGADTHKGSHALAAVDEGTGRVRGSREIKAHDPGHLAAVRWARSLDEDRVWAIEDCRSCSRRLERSLKRGAVNQPRVLDRVDRQLRKLDAGARVTIVREQIIQLRGLTRQIDTLARELAQLVIAHRPKLLDEMGCGALTAAILIG